MADDLPRYVREFSCTKVSSGAVTYHLQATSETLGGWALATVNDGTGELMIQSDYGSWSFRWSTNPSHLGCESLTHFIAGRFTGDGDAHYLANKLTSQSEREHFDSNATVDHMQRELIKKRLEAGRDLIEWYGDDAPGDRISVWDDDPPRRFHEHKVWDRSLHKYEDWPLTRSIARELYDSLDEIRGEDNADRFQEAFFRISGHDLISSEPWHEDMKYTPSPGYMQLLHGILPAVIKVCFAQLYPGRHRCEKRMGREDGAGHWRDFHRGHGCHLDPNPVAAPVAHEVSP